MFKLQFHKLKPQRPMMLDHALLLAFFSLSFSFFLLFLSTSISSQLSLDLTKKPVDLWKERDKQKKSTCHHPTPCHCLPWLVTSILLPAATVTPPRSGERPPPSLWYLSSHPLTSHPHIPNGLCPLGGHRQTLSFLRQHFCPLPPWAKTSL